tara:strand:+ start:24163 stop:25116 length:954 start_codon:yes stop_codon:yes gene_type:complete
MPFARCLWLVLFGTATAWGQVEVYWQADTTEVTLGQPVDLRLVMAFPTEVKPDEPNLTDVLSAASYRSESRSAPEAKNGLTHVTLIGTIRYFELGSQEIPELEVAFVRASGDTLSATARGLNIEVISVLEEGDQALRDIKPPVVIEGGIPLWIVVIGALLTLLVMGFLLAYWIRRRRSAAGERVSEPEPVDYVAEFERIASMGLLERGEFKTYYSLLADNLRRYIEEALVIEAMEKTTAELDVALRDKNVPDGEIRQILGYLSTADLVKFARFHPEIDSAHRVPEAGVAILRALEDHQKKQAAKDELDREVNADAAL